MKWLKILDWLQQQLTQAGLNETSAQLLTQIIPAATFLLLAIATHFIIKAFLLSWVKHIASKSKYHWDDLLVENKFFHYLARILPALIIYSSASLMFPYSENLYTLTQRLATPYMAFVAMMMAISLSNTAETIYAQSPAGKGKPVKSYFQVVKIFVYLIGAIFILATLMNASPWGFISGLGALTAVIMLVFKDSILGFVASIQIAAYDMLRPGDWIEMPKYGADGEVLEISLNTVKVQNWDKTITTIPTYALISDSFKNWRGMSESDGRRIKRSIRIDMNSVKFCDQKMLEKFKKIQYIQNYLEKKIQEIQQYNKEKNIDTSCLVNGRNLTNLGTFRAYLKEYLKNHPKINQNMTLLVRHLPPSNDGIPIEIYCFSSDKTWANYEDIQADIFDHVLAIIPEFELRVFQYPSGLDLQTHLSTPKK